AQSLLSSRVIAVKPIKCIKTSCHEEKQAPRGKLASATQQGMDYVAQNTNGERFVASLAGCDGGVHPGASSASRCPGEIRRSAQRA
ncbi:MAG: hypothetical protein ACREJM_00085, partial [Candidatus Saccharimonadales bacterium]